MMFAQKELLKFSGMKPEEYEIRRIKISTGEDGQPIYANTIVAGESSKPTMILVHGYGSSAAHYYKVLRGLAQNFHVIAMDMVGQGASSRPTFDAETAQEAIQFFVNFFENFRIAMGNITDFFLVGHSFGGYMCGQYALQYPKHIRKLLLLSPVGVKKTVPFDYHSNQVYPKGQELPMLFKYMFKLPDSLNINDKTILRELPEKTSWKLLESQVKKAFEKASKEEVEAFTEFTFQFYLQPGDTEFSPKVLFDSGVHAYYPLSDPEKGLANNKLPFPISFVFGDRDWMDNRGASDIIRANKHYFWG